MMDKLQRIATEAGVSKNTVLRILRGENKEVWSSSIRRAGEVRELAAKLGYLPNGSARAIRRGKFNCVSLVLSTRDGRSYLTADLFNAIHDALSEHGTRLIVSKLADEKLTDRETVPWILRDWSCDGLLINYTDHIPPEMVRLIGHYKIPSIWINSRQETDCVYYDDFAGSMNAVKHLQSLGHRHIAYVDFIPLEPVQHTHYSRLDRYRGYAKAMGDAGLPAYSRDHFAGVPIEERLAATRALLRPPDRPTAIIAYDSGERLMYAAALEGVDVPRDVSLITFSSTQPSRPGGARGETFFGRDIATVRVPSDLAGTVAVQMLRQKIEHPKAAMPTQVLQLQFSPGDTCGAPK